MFDSDPPYTSEPKSAVRALLEAKDNRKLKKALFLLARDRFSDTVQYQMDYYKCVNAALKAEQLQGPALDKQILVCKTPLEDMGKHIEKTNDHAQVKVRRCVRSKQKWLGDSADRRQVEEAEWDCLNRYHRRYLYYYPRLKDEQYARYYA